MTVLQVIMICTQRVEPIASASAPSSIDGPPPYPAAAPTASHPIWGVHISAQHKQRTHGRPHHDVQQNQPIGGGAGPPHWRAARAAHTQLELNTHALPLSYLQTQWVVIPCAPFLRATSWSPPRSPARLPSSRTLLSLGFTPGII